MFIMSQLSALTQNIQHHLLQAVFTYTEMKFPRMNSSLVVG